MKNDLTLNFVAALTLVLMVTFSFLIFYQTTFGKYIINYVSYLLLAYVHIADLGQMLIPLLFVLYAVAAFLIYFLKPNKTKWLEFLVFLPLIPTILSFSSSSWIWQIPSLIGIPMITFPQESTFLETAIYGIIIFSCLIVLKFILKIKTTRQELFSRGGNSIEIKKAIFGSFSYLLIILLASACLSVVAASVLIVAQPLGVALIQITPYATLVLGGGFLTLLCVLVYYYLVQKR